MGYTPLFDTLTSGTLCGRWPDIGLWPIVLSLSDKHGHVDVTPTYIASITGLDVTEVEACMARFCEPDKYSRTQDHDGRRLTLIDDARPWGWKIVNHGKYREKARKAAHDAKRAESGENSERMRTRRDPTRPAITRPQTQTQTKTEDKDGRRKRRSRTPPEDYQPSDEIRSWASTEFPNVSLDRELAKFLDYEFATPKSDWGKCFRNWVRKAGEVNASGRSGKESAIERVNRATGGARF